MTNTPRAQWWAEVKRYRHFYLFVSPFFILFAVFGLYPLLFSLFLSFMKWDGLTAWHFVGASNFVAMADDEILWRSLWNTLVIGLLYIPPMMILAFLFAQVLNTQWLKMRAFYRAAFFLPCVTPMVVIAIVFSLIFSAERGVLNYWLGFAGVKAVPWLTSEEWSKVSVAILVVWRWTGYNMILMLAGLQGIPGEYYEAAMVDGAGALQRMRAITMPMMRPTFLFCGLLSLLGTIYMFDEIFVLTSGGPGTSSTNFGMYLFNISFGDFRFGYASCVAYTVAVAVFLVTWLVSKANRRGLDEGHA
ncbi:MAG TPA: sugar ABC transporter permease [Armatimonadota bacterium]|jgi:cellobiose transport system permease protein